MTDYANPAKLQDLILAELGMSDRIGARRLTMATATKRTNKPRTQKVAAKTAPKKKGASAKAAARSSALVARPIAGLKGSGLVLIGRTQKLELRASLGMPRNTFGKVVNVAERTIAEVEAGGDSVQKLKRPYNEVYKLCEALSEVVDPACLGQWFQTPNDSFDGLTPIEVIEQGDIDQLWNMVLSCKRVCRADH